MNKSPKFKFNKNANPFSELLRWSKWAKEDDKKTAREWGQEYPEEKTVEEMLNEELRYVWLTDGRN